MEVLSAWVIGRPALTSVESWRVKITLSLAFTPLPNAVFFQMGSASEASSILIG
jgi:hypothetical protein